MIFPGSRGWSTVPGKVLHSDYSFDEAARGRANRWVFELKYEYAVEGTVLRGRELSHAGNYQPSEEECKRLLARYQAYHVKGLAGIASYDRGGDVLEAGDDGALDASLTVDTGEADGGDAVPREVAPSPCGPTAPTCYARPYGGCCMQDQKSAARCGEVFFRGNAE